MIRNAMCLRLQRGWSKLIKMLIVSKIISDEEKKRAWKSYHEKFLKTEFPCDRNSLSQADTITDTITITCSIDKDMVRDSISKITNGKAVKLSGVMSDIIKTAGEAGVEKTQ